MIIIPAIDLKGGNCVRLFQGKAEERTVYFDDPKEAALKLISDDAKRIHVVDLDGAFRGKEGSPNRRIIGEIAALSEVPIEVGGGIRTVEDAEELLEVGVRWVILGTVLVKDPEAAGRIAEAFPGRVIAGIDAKGGMVATHGWVAKSEVMATELARFCEEIGVSGIIYTDISRDGALVGPNVEETVALARSTSLPVIASGGVSSLEDLKWLKEIEEVGIEGVIVGKALYEHRFTLQEAMEVVA